MTALPSHKMTVDEYLGWAEGRPGRYELFAGTVYAMAPERAQHAEVKYAAQTALLTGIQRARLPCHMLPDGMTVRIDRDTTHEPDAHVYCGRIYCGRKLKGSSIEVPNPVVVVEVLSPSTQHVDASLKLAGYFSVASVQHYLILDPERRMVLHHARGDGEAISTRIVRNGVLELKPPGLQLTVGELFQDTD